MTHSASLLSDFRREAGLTRPILAAVPEGKLDWQPHDKSWSLAKLAGHVAENPSWVGAMIEDEMDVAAGGWEPFEPTSSQELLEVFDKNVKLVEDALEERDDAFLEGNWQMKHGDQVIMSQPKFEVIRQIVIHHFIHHRGQLTVYLRLLDVPVPSTYGPTADFPDFNPN
jgi:uncharacterized damage-inducible protein DinB